jgi:hypothetical protein
MEEARGIGNGRWTYLNISPERTCGNQRFGKKSMFSAVKLVEPVKRSD